jgi:O-antigen/teichoic acid export membrane protein
MKRLQTRALIGSAWTLFGFGSQKFIQLASNLILTRLLFPEAFGLITLANVLLIGLGMFSDIGIKPSIVQHQDGDTVEFLNTAWTLQVARGFVLWGAACALAYPVALVYGQPILLPVVCALGATAAINGFSTTALAVKEKKIDFAALILVQTASSFLSLCVTAILAWVLRSVWALTFGALISAFINVLIGYVAAPSHPHQFRLQRKALTSMVRFGQWILYSTIATYLSGQGLRAIQGAFIPISAFGVLSIAQLIAWMPVDLVGQLTSTVGYASLAELKAKGGDFRSALHKVRMGALALGIPLFVALALASNVIISTLYDQRYHDAATYLPILALTGAIAVVPSGYRNALLALGKSKLQFWLVLYLAAARIAGITLGFWLGGIFGMLVGDIIAVASQYPLVAMSAYRYGIFDPLCDAAAISVIVASAIGISALTGVL